MKMNSPSPTRNTGLRHYFCVRLPVYLFIITVGYVLSIGPLFWQWHASAYLNGKNPGIIAQIYFPLALLCDLSKIFSGIINWYINLWIL
ncbi:hypothetical protein MNBD_PLANCTO02-3021 [hydrothermal vent metagenome]|uniref:Uncharacterized protein n=1 Tax=hydrothermal vent metagenome TaxID=652676 RepID=A0A3B1D1G5_9ZZZZ